MKIREYRKGDFPGIMEVWSATGLSRPERGDDENTVERSIAMGGAMLVMLSDDSEGERITGTSWITFDGRRLYLHHFGIIPEHQGKGLAASLLRESLRIAKEKGYQIKLEVHRTNETAVRLYKKAGFEYLGDYDVYIIRNIQSLEF
ncbi:MAG: GNAT family N-acetyltransferase [Bacteroidales bacterium]|jgi:ribosomal protein S18 acetylase RimI-like enzyme|nr:GNAT family N-acetyltransferase [Bacteroidales bacterium]MDD3736290.1 GNAT family N-acetyltransferase [Bacteroidales bacterium]NLD64142.1 GNAT family N-acetyltransferase [Bacteroidales bacterium]HNT92960.1 GNAT family N-acetyltransferase [Bacteroidales bacterium]HOO65352.1 GNAT family N-acetyltransferase [Bacteroidales bacterium]